MKSSQQDVMTRNVGIREVAAELVHQAEGEHCLQLAGQLVESEAHRLCPAVRRVWQRSPRVDTHQQWIEDVLLHPERHGYGYARQADSVVAPNRHPGQEGLSRFRCLGHSTRW